MSICTHLALPTPPSAQPQTLDQKVDDRIEPSAVETVIRGGGSVFNVYETTVERLGAAIKMGLYQAGEQLPNERDLAQLMGVSRTTLREAIRVLVAQGFLRVQRGRGGGTFVAQEVLFPTVLELQQRLSQQGKTLGAILDYRLVVEPGVAELAAQRIDGSQVQALQSLVHQMTKVTHRFQEHRRLDTEFHWLIARSTQVERLAAVVAGIHTELSDLLMVIPHSPAACADSASQHQQLLEAIQTGQATLARTLMADHVARTSSLLKGLLG